MKILFVHENFSYGGGEKMFYWVACKMKEYGHDIHFCFLYRSIKNEGQDISQDCLNIKTYKSYFLRNFSLFTQGYIRLLKYIKHNNYKNIVCFGFNSFLILSILKVFLHFKLLVSERGDPSAARFKILRNHFFSKADYSVFQTEGAHHLIPGAKHYTIIPNPIRIPNEIWKDCDSQDFIINVGRLDIEQKRQDLLIYAFHHIHQLFPSYKLKFVGCGGDLEKLISLSKLLSIEDYVIFDGFKKDVKEELLSSRIFVLSSDFEGIPNALLEAMSLGMPVVSTKCSPGGAEFLISNYSNGILAEKGDYMSIADAITYMIENDTKRISMAYESRHSVLPFSEDKISHLWDIAISDAFDNDM